MATLKDSTGGRMGIDSRASAAVTSASGSPAPSPPSRMRDGSAKLERRQRRSVPRHGRDDGDAPALEAAHCRRRGLTHGDRQPECAAHGARAALSTRTDPPYRRPRSRRWRRTRPRHGRSRRHCRILDAVEQEDQLRRARERVVERAAAWRAPARQFPRADGPGSSRPLPAPARERPARPRARFGRRGRRRRRRRHCSTNATVSSVMPEASASSMRCSPSSRMSPSGPRPRATSRKRATRGLERLEMRRTSSPAHYRGRGERRPCYHLRRDEGATPQEVPGRDPPS